MPQHFANKLAQLNDFKGEVGFFYIMTRPSNSWKLVPMKSVLNEKSGLRVKSKEVDLDKVEVLAIACLLRLPLGDSPGRQNSNTAKILLEGAERL